MPLAGRGWSVAEIERAAEIGLSGVTFWPERYNGLELFSDEMDRVWSAIEAADLSVGIHGSFGSKMPSFARHPLYQPRQDAEPARAPRFARTGPRSQSPAKIMRSLS